MLRPATLCDHLFTGLTILIPVLFILRIEKLKPRLLNQDALVIAFNITLLFATLGFVAIYFAEFFIAFYSSVEYEQYAFINRAAGPYWYGFWIPVSINMILPQLIWFKKIRSSVKITYIWFGLAFSYTLLIKALYILLATHRDYIPTTIGWVWNYILPPLPDFALSIITTTGIVLIVYLIVSKSVSKTTR